MKTVRTRALVGVLVVFWALRLQPGPFEWLASGRS